MDKSLFEDKQLIFLEKDYKCPASDDCIDSANFFLESWLDLPTEQIDAMIVHYQYNQMDADVLTDILFNPENIIVTYSGYVQGSNYQFQKYMIGAARNDVRGLTYIDTSGALIEYLNKNLRDIEKDVVRLISAINTNNIISINYKQNNDAEKISKIEPQLIKIDVKGIYDDFVTFKEIVPDNVIPIAEHVIKIHNRKKKK